MHINNSDKYLALLTHSWHVHVDKWVVIKIFITCMIKKNGSNVWKKKYDQFRCSLILEEEINLKNA